MQTVNTITKDKAILEQPTEMRFHFVHQMTGDQAIRLTQYLYGCHKLYRDNILSEYWDLGIGLCRERLIKLGYTFQNLRPGYPGLIMHPDGSISRSVID